MPYWLNNHNFWQYMQSWGFTFHKLRKNNSRLNKLRSNFSASNAFFHSFKRIKIVHLFFRLWSFKQGYQWDQILNIKYLGHKKDSIRHCDKYWAVGVSTALKWKLPWSDHEIIKTVYVFNLIRVTTLLLKNNIFPDYLFF